MMADATHHMGGGGREIIPSEAGASGRSAGVGPASTSGQASTSIEAEQFLTSSHSAMLRMRPFLLTFPAGECHCAQPRYDFRHPCCLHTMTQKWSMADVQPTAPCGTLYCCRVQRSRSSIRLSVSEPWPVPPHPHTPATAPAAHLLGPHRTPSSVPPAADVEGQFLADVAQRRWPVLIFIFCFDVFCYMLRLGARLAANVRFGLVELAAEMGPQLANMGFCYLFLGLVNTRSRRGGGMASRQVSV